MVLYYETPCWMSTKLSQDYRRMAKPTFHLRRTLLSDGYEHIVGVDEAGTGALAGPVFAAAVIFPTDSRLGAVDDSKKLTANQRDALFDLIKERSRAWAIGRASVEEIMEKNVRQAAYLAMKRAILAVDQVDFALVDAWEIPDLSVPQKAIVKGDSKIKSIAAASILAKVARDREMAAYSEHFPEYGFAQHKGYGTKAHRAAIEAHGPCAIHRLTYGTFSRHHG